MLHLKRLHFMEWVRAMMAVTLGAEGHLPPMAFQRETDSVWEQLSERLCACFILLGCNLHPKRVCLCGGGLVCT